jgi:transcriptional regulator with XRE-family HTH domain
MIDEEGPARVQEMLAANLRRLRIARHLSLSELARGTGMGKATLSGIENGHANPTIDTLAGLAVALRVSVTELLAELPLEEVRISRAGQARFSARGGLAHRPLETFAACARGELDEIALKARQSLELGPGQPRARACVYVLEGPLIAGPVQRSTELDAGDYISFPADEPYLYSAGRAPARALQLLVSG